MDTNRYCTCGNPAPMSLKSGQHGEFYSCSDWKCKMTQNINERQPPIGSVNNQRPAPEVPPEIVLNSKKQGYEMRKAWHEKNGIPHPETTQHLTTHLADNK